MPEASPKPRILVVDDEPDLIAVLRMGLQMEGFEVLEAADGAAGLERARADKPDLIVLDLMLPKMDGYQVCRSLKFDSRYKSLPIFILSARPGEQDRRLALEMGADDFIRKPYDLKELVAKIRGRLKTGGGREAA
jgi:DNA-binding response OmpR family regulator